MTLDDFDFELPPRQIAQHPPPVRGESRLLALDRRSGVLRHSRFPELAQFLRAGDLLVLNDTRVIPARLLGHKVPTGGRAELLLVRPLSPIASELALTAPAGQEVWSCLGQASKGLKVGTRLSFGDGFGAQVVASPGGGEVHVRFEAEAGASLGALLEAAGRLPLPPYIDREPSSEDLERYQTVFAAHAGSVAAPTAGLHFTKPLLERLEAGGVELARVTLEVGPGTFMPVREDLHAHKMHLERYTLPEQTVEQVARCRARGGRVVAVGTTVVRALESATGEDGTLRAGPGQTELFIRPGDTFRQVDALLTNFHLPRSTLLMLVAAFAGLEHTLSAYREAVAQGYRFFSYGDAMFIAELGDD
jgi:S-adenosylmethionine:tRNA ribosyltransferase-isomerase